MLKQKPIIMFKYVDDNVSSKKLLTERTYFHPWYVQREAAAGLCIPELLQVSGGQMHRGEMGMVVHMSKAKFFCISDSHNYLPKAFIMELVGVYKSVNRPIADKLFSGAPPNDK